jgi:hypothetical protein
VLDEVTTFHNVHAGYVEQNPTYAFVKDKPIGLAISLAATDAVTLWLAHHYAPTHPKAAKIAVLIIGGAHWSGGIRNAMTWAALNRPPEFVQLKQH